MPEPMYASASRGATCESEKDIANTATFLFLFAFQLTVSELKKIKYLREPHYPAKLTSAENAYEKLAIKEHRTVIDPHYIESERMPTLEEVLVLLEKEAPHMKCMIEVKERTHISAMCHALKDLYNTHPWMYKRCFVASFNPFILYGLRKLDPNIVLSFLFIDNWSSHLLKNAKDMKIRIPFWIEYNFPLRYLVDDLVWMMGTTQAGLHFLGANISACEVKALNENQIRYDRSKGIITSTWVANNEQQKEWLLQQGV
jgi:glycerophosphoryl diester phosphodiesterase